MHDESAVLAFAKQYDLPILGFLLDDDPRSPVTLVRCPQNIEGIVKWAIRQNSRVLAKPGNVWELEPMPSERDEVFLTRCRFDSLEEALEAWLTWIN